jgi:glycosyltransferase involved in cell wall biosynthesis
MKNPVVISRPITTQIVAAPYAPSLPPYFFMACRIDAQKGLHIVMEACHQLHKALPNQEWSLLFAGVSRNSYLNQLFRQVKKNGLDKRIEYLGRISREAVIQKMQKAVAFVNAPIYGEPFAGTVLEAIANNAPLLTSNDGSALEVVKPGLTCLVHEKLDASSLARNMQSILCEPDLAARISASAKADVLSRFGTEIILDKTEAYLKNAINSSALHQK